VSGLLIVDFGRSWKSVSKSSWDFQAGDAITSGRTVVKSLGGGRRYEVYLVWDEKLFALVVAKIVRPDRVDDEDAMRGLRREADALARLAHPVLLRGFDTVVEGPRPHILVEHLEGPTLAALIDRHGRLPLEQLLPLALQLCSALHYLAGERMVHLDVKPDNIIVGLPPRLIDLSVTRTLDEARRISRPIGTAAYMSPEQCRADNEPGLIGSPADIWGLGASLHEAIAGTPPFGDRGAAGTAEYPQLARAPTPLPRRVPGPLAEQVRRCLDPDPAQRPSASEFALALEPLVAALPRKLVLGRRTGRVI
jgi:eukaryotic-like serine/threonine-protein kinase